MSALLAPLESLFAWLLAASWQASVLALLVLGLQLLLGARLNPRWRYALWLLVLARLLLPALPESALSLFQFTPPPPTAFIEPVTHPLFAPAAPLPTTTAISAPIPAPAHPLSAYSILALLWLLGAVSLLVLTWVVNAKFLRQVAAAPEVIDPELRQLFAEARAELAITSSIRLVESAQVQSPAIMGLVRPTLLLPMRVREQFDAAELRLIFLHELAHLKRGDVVVQGLIAVLQILHWFNPVLWYAFRRMRIDREPATDALVLSRAGEEEKERYGLMLIKLLEHFNQRHSLPTLVGILEDKDQFKRRFTLIAKYTRGAYGWSLLGVAVIGALAVACLTKEKVASKEIPKRDLQHELIVAAQKNDAPALQKLLDDGAVYDAAKEPLRPTLLFCAGGPDVAELLIRRGVDAKVTTVNGRNALHEILFSYHRSGETARVLLKAGADPNAANDRGETPLMYAGHGEGAEALIEYGAKLDTKTKLGESGWQAMTELGDASYYDALLRHGLPFDPAKDGPNLLVGAANAGGVEAVKWALAHGTDPNQPGTFSQNDPKLPLSASLITWSNPDQENHREITQLLLDHGAKGSWMDALAVAASGNKETAALLHHFTALHVSDFIYSLLEGKPVVDLEKSITPGSTLPDKDKTLALSIAALRGDLPVAEFLVKQGADVNSPLPVPLPVPWADYSPLALASEGGHLNVVNFLLQNGAQSQPGFALLRGIATSR